jgi:hypothetical protein
MTVGQRDYLMISMSYVTRQNCRVFWQDLSNGIAAAFIGNLNN